MIKKFENFEEDWEESENIKLSIKEKTFNRIIKELEDGILIAEEYAIVSPTMEWSGIALFSEDGSDYGYSVLPYNDTPGNGWRISNYDVEIPITDEQLHQIKNYIH